MNGNVLSNIGKLLAQYYLDLYCDSHLVSLFIDKLTFEDICRTSGLGINDCLGYIHAKFPSISVAKDSYQSLALVAFQIMVSNDVNNNGVYDKLRAEIPSLKGVDNTTLMKWYFEDGQDQIWATVNKFFVSKKKEIYNFPVGRQYGSGRYVRYPISQQLLPTRQIIQYADKFRQVLDPHMPYTFEEFKRRIKFNWNHDNELVKHLIFSFYQTWDGQSSQDYISRRSPKNHQQIIPPGEIILEIDDAKHSFSILRYDSNSKNPIKTNSKKLLNVGVKFRVFEYNPDFQDWSLLRINSIPQEISYLGILTSSQFLQALQSVIKDSPEIYNDGESAFAIFNSDDACMRVLQKLGLKKEILSIWLSGGIKVGYNTYSKEALPIINFKSVQKMIYVNSQKIEFDEPRTKIKLGDLISTPANGSYYIKLPFCAPLQVRIASFENNTNTEEIKFTGFSSDEKSLHLYDKLTDKSLLLRGLESFAALRLPSCETTYQSERGFLLHKKSFERGLKLRGKYNGR